MLKRGLELGFLLSKKATSWRDRTAATQVNAKSPELVFGALLQGLRAETAIPCRECDSVPPSSQP